MKKVFITFFTLSIFLLIGMPAQSQIRLGVKAGANLSGLSFSGDDDFRDKNVTGFQIGPMIEFLFAGSFGVEGGVMFAQKGIKFYDGKIDEKMGYIDVPVSLKYRYNLSETVKPFATAGPYVSFRVSGDKKLDQVQDTWKAKDFGAGLNFGLGVELFKFLQVSAGYGLSLTDNYQASKDNDDDFSAKGHVWSANVAVFF